MRLTDPTMQAKTITIHITDIAGGGVTVLTTAGTPLPGLRLTPAEALATDLLNTCARRASDVHYWQGKDRALDLVQELINPDELGYAVTDTVRRRASAVLGRLTDMQGNPITNHP